MWVEVWLEAGVDFLPTERADFCTALSLTFSTLLFVWWAVLCLPRFAYKHALFYSICEFSVFHDKYFCIRPPSLYWPSSVFPSYQLLHLSSKTNSLSISRKETHSRATITSPTPGLLDLMEPPFQKIWAPNLTGKITRPRVATQSILRSYLVFCSLELLESWLEQIWAVNLLILASKLEWWHNCWPLVQNTNTKYTWQVYSEGDHFRCGIYVLRLRFVIIPRCRHLLQLPPPKRLHFYDGDQSLATVRYNRHLNGELFYIFMCM